MPLRIPATVTGLQASIEAQAKKAGRNLKINLGTSAKSIEGLSQPLGRITGKADQFTKSMEAANARVLAFGASVGVLSAVTQGFKELVTTTIEVEKQMASINAILGQTTSQLDAFKKTIFDVAKNTEQSFTTVSEAALELSRQGLSAEEVVRRLNDAMILSRLSGQGAAEAVAGLTAAINSFGKGTVSSTEVVNKFSQAAKNAAVSERDLAEAIKRAGSVADIAGVSFDELVGVVSAVQQKTARGGAVIGNSFKTIFTRIQSIDKLKTLQNLGAQVTDAEGNILSATRLIQNLAIAIKDLPEARQLQIAENLVGKFQVAPFVAILQDYNSEASTAIRLTEISQKASTEAYERNAALNKTLSAAINEATVNLRELANTLGEIGVTDSLKNILGFFNSLVGNIKTLLEGEGIGSDFARGIVKGIGNILSGPGLAIFGAIIAKLTIDLARFGVGSLQTFFGLNKAAKEQATLQGQIASTLLGNKSIQSQIMAIENSTLSIEQKRAAQTKFFTTALNEQLRIMTQMQGIAARVAPGVARGTRGARGRAAGGYIPNFNAVRGYGTEMSDISRGVGGAPASARPVTIPNFNFGGGQRGTMVANTSEFIVPNFAGGGSAIFNQDMVSSMGLPAGARRVSAAGGFIPNFVDTDPVSTVGKTKGMTLAQAVAAFRAGSLNRSALTSGFGKEAVDARLGAVSVAGRPVAAAGSSGILRIPGRRYGVAALFPSKKTTTTSTNFTGEQTNPGIIGLQQRGFTGISFSGVQISDLQTMQRGIKGGMKESENRRKIGRLFAEPLARYGGEIIPDAGFQNDELTDIQDKIKKLGRGKGAKLFSTAVEGGIFEAAVSLVTKGARGIRQFKDHTTEREPFDFEEGGRADTKFKRAFRFTDDLVRADAKRTASNSAVQTLIFKALNDPAERKYILGLATRKQKGKGRTGAGGYIPNFNVSPLQDAIARETGAGLPVNQVRINQSPKLRNAGNPMGLAVTNTRDEPTGAIPNFRIRGFAPSTPTSTKARGPRDAAASSELLTKFIVLQTVVAGLSGVVGETTNQSELFNKSLKAMNIAMTAFLASSAFGGAGRLLGGASNLLTGQAGVNLGARAVERSRALAERADRLERAGNRSRFTGPGFVGGPRSRRGRRLVRQANMTRLGGNITSRAGRLAGFALRVAGPAGAFTGALLAVSHAVNYFSGRAELAGAMTERLATTTQLANKELENLKVPQSFKDSLRAQAKSSAALAGQSIQDARSKGLLGFNRLGGAFRGTDDKAFQQAITGTVSAARTEGISNAVIQAQLRQMDITRAIRGSGLEQGLNESDSAFASRALASKGGKKEQFNPQEEVQDFFDALEKQMADFSAQETINRLVATIDPNLLKELRAVMELEARASRGGRELSDEERRRRGALDERLTEFARGSGVQGSDIIAREVLTQGFRGSVTRGETSQQRIERIQAETAKLRLKTEIEIARVKAEEITSDEIQLSRGQALGTLRAEEKITLEKNIALSKNRKKVDLDISKIAAQEIANLKALNFDKEKQEALQKLISKQSLSQLASEEGRKNLIKNIVGLEEKGALEAKLILDFFEEQAQALIQKGKAQEENLKKDFQSRVENEKALEIQRKRVNLLQVENKSLAIRQNAALDIQRVAADFARSSIQNNPNLTSLERSQALLANLPQQQNVARAELQNSEIQRLLNEIIQVESRDPTQNFEDLRVQLNNILSGRTSREAGISEVRASLEESLAFGERLGASEADQQPMRQFLLSVEALEAAFEKLGLTLNKEEQEAKNRADPENFTKFNTLLRGLTQELNRAQEQLRFDAIRAGDASGFVGSARQIRENRLRSLAGNNVSAQIGVTQQFALQGLRDTQRTGATRAERRQAERQLPFVEEQFRLQQKLNVLYEDADNNLDKIKKVEDEILDIERKRQTVNEKIGALIEDTFIKSAEDIEKQLGKSLVADGERFKKSVTDGLVDAIILGQDLGDTLRQAAAEFFSSRAKSQLEAAFDSILSGSQGALGPIPERGERGGLLNVLGGAFRGLGGLLGFNSGGLVTGGSRRMDDVPTLLTGGEFVIRRSAVEKYGPEFLEALNRGGIQTMQRGGLFTPGTFGQGSITGSRNLLDFATQNLTTGQQDRIGGGAGFGFASLEPQSARLTMFGRRNSPLFQQEQDSKREAFGLFTRQSQLEEQLAEQRRQQRRAFRNSLITFVAATALGELTRPQGESVSTDAQTGLADQRQSIMLGGGGIGGGGARAGGGASTVLTPRATRTPTTPTTPTAVTPALDLTGQAGLDIAGGAANRSGGALRAVLNLFRGGGGQQGGAGQGIMRRAANAFDGFAARLMETSFFLHGVADGRETPLNLDNPLFPPRLPQARPQGRATGGYVSPSAGVDSVPAMLTGGEFVMNAGATQRIGRGNLAALNGGSGVGEGNDAVVARLDELIAVSGEGGDTVINITVNSDGTQTTEGEGDTDQQTLALRIRDVVRQTIDEEKRLGGSLRRQ